MMNKVAKSIFFKLSLLLLYNMIYRSIGYSVVTCMHIIFSTLVAQSQTNIKTDLLLTVGYLREFLIKVTSRKFRIPSLLTNRPQIITEITVYASRFEVCVLNDAFAIAM